MDREIFERLDILCLSNQVSQIDKEKTIKALEYLEKKLNVKIEKEIGGMFATHLAKALSRINNKEAIEKTPEQVEKAIENCPELLEEAENLFKNILGIEKVPTGEISFIAMYICLLLNADFEKEVKKTL
ncbi:PRD domain-containing protein [Thermoanaerobacter siderophilus]|nr:PRD domain-containing protein [Thermoanaerobacter siderophilus]